MTRELFYDVLKSHNPASVVQLVEELERLLTDCGFQIEFHRLSGEKSRQKAQMKVCVPRDGGTEFTGIRVNPCGRVKQPDALMRFEWSRVQRLTGERAKELVDELLAAGFSLECTSNLVGGDGKLLIKNLETERLPRFVQILADFLIR